MEIIYDDVILNQIGFEITGQISTEPPEHMSADIEQDHGHYVEIKSSLFLQGRFSSNKRVLVHSEQFGGWIPIQILVQITNTLTA